MSWGSGPASLPTAHERSGDDQLEDIARLTSETAQLKSLLGAVQTVLQFLDLRKREEEKEEEKEKEEEGIEEIRGREEEGGRRKRVAAVGERG